jgi:hypothetical protein
VENMSKPVNELVEMISELKQLRLLDKALMVDQVLDKAIDVIRAHDTKIEYLLAEAKRKDS